MFIINLTFTATPEALAETRPKHIAYLKPFYEQGIFHIGGRKADGSGGLILTNNMNEKVLHAIMEEDPFIKSNNATYRVTEFTPVMVSKAAEALIG